jgi:hypothetical protein
MAPSIQKKHKAWDILEKHVARRGLTKNTPSKGKARKSMGGA